MKKVFPTATALIVVALVCSSANAGVVKKGVDGTKKGVTSAVDGTKKGVNWTVNGTKKGVHSSVSGTKKVLKKMHL
jgi:hypothetical protein